MQALTANSYLIKEENFPKIAPFLHTSHRYSAQVLIEWWDNFKGASSRTGKAMLKWHETGQGLLGDTGDPTYRVTMFILFHVVFSPLKFQPFPKISALRYREVAAPFGSDINVLLTKITQVCGQQVSDNAGKEERKKERKGRVEGSLFMGVGFPD
jgi:hypothetical protein